MALTHPLLAACDAGAAVWARQASQHEATAGDGGSEVATAAAAVAVEEEDNVVATTPTASHTKAAV